MNRFTCMPHILQRRKMVKQKNFIESEPFQLDSNTPILFSFFFTVLHSTHSFTVVEPLSCSFQMTGFVKCCCLSARLFYFLLSLNIGTQIRLSRKQQYPVCCFLVFSSVHWIGTVQTYCGVFLKIQIIKQRKICNKREYTVNIPYTMSIRWRMWEIAYIWMRRQTAEKTTTK